MKRNLGLTAAFRHAKWLAALGLTLAALTLSLVLDLSGAIQPYRLKTLDVLFRRVPLPAASPQVVVVTVDQPDLDFFKNQGVVWPWPRQLYAHIIDYCKQAGARAVIFDILFTEASSYGPEDDNRLGQAAAAAGNVVFAFSLSREEKGANPEEAALLDKAGLQIPGPRPRDPVGYRSMSTPVRPLLDGAEALGNVECKPDEDGIYRRVPLVLPFKDRWLPMLPFAAFHLSGNNEPLKFVEDGLLVGNLRIPLDDQGNLLLKYRGPSRSHKRFSAANVISSEARVRHNLPPIYPPEDFAGKWVLVGLTAPGLLDLKASPVGGGLSRGGGPRHPAGQPAPGAIFSGPCPAGPCGPGPWSSPPPWSWWSSFSRGSRHPDGFAALALAYLGLVGPGLFRLVGRPGAARGRPGPELRAGHGVQLRHRRPPEALHPPHVRPVHVRARSSATCWPTRKS